MPDERALRRKALGASGEDAVAAWYEARGYEILDRNWRCREGEIDIVCRHGGTIVFCEVKSRTSVAFGTPAEAVTPAKVARLRRLATRWLEGSRPAGRPGLRFDVAAVLGGEIDVIEGAF